MNSIELMGVYNADGGLVGELSYVLGRTFQGKHCELCDITHSPFRRKKAWDDFTSQLSIPFTLLHLNELTPELAVFVGQEAPVVIIRENMELSVLISAQEMARCGGQVSAFADLVNRNLDARWAGR
jgi:hypothetical protein